MTNFPGDCACCDSHPFPGGDPDPDWHAEYYWAAKYAQVVRDGMPDLQYYYGTTNFDSGERYLGFDELTTFGSESKRDSRVFFNLAERLRYFASTPSEFAPFKYFTPYQKLGSDILPTLNTQQISLTQTPAYTDFTYFVTGSTVSNESAVFSISFGGTIVASVSSPVLESQLDSIASKLDVVPFKAGCIQIGLQTNPYNVATTTLVEGGRTGPETACYALPESPSLYFVFNGFEDIGKILKAFCVNTRPVTGALVVGLKTQRDKQILQIGSKAPAGTVLKTYRKFTMPDGYNLIPANVSYLIPSLAASRVVAEKMLITDKRIPANSTFVEEVEESYNEGDLTTYDPSEGEVYFFDGRPYPFPTTMPTVSEILTPYEPRLIYYRINGTAIGLYVTHEDRCLSHEIWCSIDGGTETLLGTITSDPTYVPYNPAGNPPPPAFYSAFAEGAFHQNPLGFIWGPYVHTGITSGSSYAYRAKSYYDTSYKSAFSLSQTLNP